MARAAAAALRGVTVDAELRSRLVGLPVMLRTSGMTATCAFLLSKGADAPAYRVAATALLAEAARTLGDDPDDAADDPVAMLERVATLPPQQYLTVELRVGALATWLSRFARASGES